MSSQTADQKDCTSLQTYSIQMGWNVKYLIYGTYQNYYLFFFCVRSYKR